MTSLLGAVFINYQLLSSTLISLCSLQLTCWQACVVMYVLYLILKNIYGLLMFFIVEAFLLSCLSALLGGVRTGMPLDFTLEGWGEWTPLYSWIKLFTRH